MCKESSKTPTWQRLGYPNYRAWVLDYIGPVIVRIPGPSVE